jgi:hypothetical protein
MPSVPPGSYERLASFPTLWTAWHAYWRGKRRRPAVAAFDLDADLGVLALQRDLAAGTFTPAAYRITLVADPKVRIVAASAIRDRVLQRALLDGIGPTYERGFIDQSFAVRSGRGAHRAALAYLGWTTGCPRSFWAFASAVPALVRDPRRCADCSAGCAGPTTWTPRIWRAVCWRFGGCGARWAGDNGV